MRVESWVALGDRREQLSTGLDESLLVHAPGLVFRVFFEHVDAFDVTFLYIRGSWLDSDQLQGFYDKQWIDDIVTPLVCGYRSSFLSPMGNRVFCSKNADGLLPSLYRSWQDVSWLRPRGGSSAGADLVVLQTDRNLYSNPSVAEKLGIDAKSLVELMVNVNVPGDYLDLGMSKYYITYQESTSHGISGGPLWFDTLEEAKRFFKEKRWDRVASGSYSPWDSFDIDLKSRRAIDDLTIPYLLAADTIVRGW